MWGKRKKESLYPCFRCDEKKARFPISRCDECESRVTDIMFGAASRGHVLEDPLVKLRRTNGRL